jgi:diguanylate cyclase (GGDEF)-like protein
VITVLTILLAVTGGHTSPFFFGYILFLGVAALWSSGIGPPLLAVVTSAAYMVGVLAPLRDLPSTPAELGRVAFNLVALTLVTYVAAIVGREQRRAREDALRLSRFDSLSGLLSRGYFMSLLEQEILRAGRSGRPFALLMLDLDGLKAANDRFGHASGDQLLRAVSETLSGDIRVTDIAARYGGDEFVLLLPETELAGAMLVADKVRIDISRLALPHDGQVIRTSCSIGVVTYPDDGRTSTELMRRADLAMYEAKRRGRDQIVRFAREARVPMAPPPAQPTELLQRAQSQPSPPAQPTPAAEPAPSAEPVTRPIADPIQVALPAPEPSAGEINARDYPALVGAPVVAEGGETVTASIAPQFEPPPGVPLDPRSVEIPPESPGRPPWESRAPH